MARRFFTAAIAVAALALPALPAAGSSPPAATARLVLPTRTIAAGSTLQATLVIHNPPGAPPLAYSACAGVPIAVRLSNRRVSQASPFWPTCAGAASTVPSGRSTFPVTIYGTYTSCTQGSPPNPGEPECPAVLPPFPSLPPGRYAARTFTLFSPSLSIPPVQVRVTR